MPEMVLARHLIETPVGPMAAYVTDSAVAMFEFTDGGREEWSRERLLGNSKARIYEKLQPLHDLLAREIEAYFAGHLREFTVPLQPIGTPFQLKVWQLLREIPYGETRTYGELAQQLGDPNLVRAVGMANGSNRLAILIPCHRVIGADGSLTGYGGGVWRKQRLLEVEQGQAGLF